MRTFVAALVAAALLFSAGAASALGARQTLQAGGTSSPTIKLPVPPLGGVTLAAAKLQLTGGAAAHAPALLPLRWDAPATPGVAVVAAEQLDRASATYTFLIAVVHGGTKPGVVHGVRSTFSAAAPRKPGELELLGFGLAHYIWKEEEEKEADAKWLAYKQAQAKGSGSTTSENGLLLSMFDATDNTDLVAEIEDALNGGKVEALSSADGGNSSQTDDRVSFFVKPWIDVALSTEYDRSLVEELYAQAGETLPPEAKPGATPTPVAVTPPAGAKPFACAATTPVISPDTNSTALTIAKFTVTCNGPLGELNVTGSDYTANDPAGGYTLPQGWKGVASGSTVVFTTSSPVPADTAVTFAPEWNSYVGSGYPVITASSISATAADSIDSGEFVKVTFAR